MDLYPNYFSISSQILVERAKKIGFSVKILCPEKNFFCISRNGKTHFFKNIKSQKTSAIALEITSDKQLTKDFLSEIKAPIINGFLWKKGQKPQNIKFPMVLKPTGESHGSGVFTNIEDKTSFLAIADQLFQKYEELIAEEFISGQDLRILCIGGKAKSAILRFPPEVIGDGKNSIEQLIEIENKSPERAEGHNAKLSHILVDEDILNFLKKNGKNLSETIPKKHESVFLTDKANTSIGGKNQRVFEKLTLKNRIFAENIAKKINPDGILGIDLLCETPEKDWDTQTWKILEMEVGPSLRSHNPSILDEWLEGFC